MIDKKQMLDPHHVTESADLRNIGFIDTDNEDHCADAVLDNWFQEIQEQRSEEFGIWVCDHRCD